MFNDFLNSTNEEEYGNDYEYFKEDDSFQLSIFGKQQRIKIVLSLKEQSLLTMFITLYKSEFAYNEIYANHVSSLLLYS